MTLSLCVSGQQGAAPPTPAGKSHRGVVPALLALARCSLLLKYVRGHHCPVVLAG